MVTFFITLPPAKANLSLTKDNGEKPIAVNLCSFAADIVRCFTSVAAGFPIATQKNTMGFVENLPREGCHHGSTVFSFAVGISLPFNPDKAGSNYAGLIEGYGAIVVPEFGLVSKK